MANSQDQDAEQVVPDEGADNDVRSVQARYLRSPSPSSFSMVSDAYTESIFMEPIHLSSAIAAKQIINEELKPKELKVDTACPGLLESAEQLLVEDLYNRVKEKIDDRSLFNTPCVMDIQRDLMMDRMESPMNSVDEVWPNIFIAEKTVAVNKGRLKRMGITHILNTGHGTTVFTGPDFYTGMEIHYMGVEVDDFPDSDISKFFRPAAEFLDEALLTYRGKVLVNSEMGISRPAVLVAAYLMIFHNMTIMEALMTIRKKRAIYPNDGFLKQLREFNENLLEEREMSDIEEGDDDNKSQGSVIEAKAHSIMVEEEDVESIMGAKVHSITVEEEDTTSIMGSVMSQIGKSSVISKQPTLIDEDEEERIYEEWRRKQGLPPKDIPKKENGLDKRLAEDGEVMEDQVEQMIHEWQRQNAKYQSLGLDDDENSLMGPRCYSPSEISDIESVTSQEIRALKKQLEASGINRMSRRRTDSVSTDSTWDMWNQRLQEIEKEAAEKYQNKDRDDHGTKNREKDIDEESVFSETNSLYNFCKKNKNKLTPLERWKIKRIQFGYHKKDSQSSDMQNKEENAGQKEDDETSKSDVDVKAYQEWKTKHQQKIGNENKEEIVELAKGEDSASIKRKQRRAEILERSKQTLEESQSICGWETESAISGSIPLSALFSNLPSASGACDTASLLSMQSGRSRISQPRSVSGQSQIPVAPISNMPAGPGDAISMASIQNWIANVVSETIAQKQNEIMMMSRASSALSMRSGDLGRNADDDKSSLLGGTSGSCISSSVFKNRDFGGTDSNSVMSNNTSMSQNTDVTGAKRKITTTSKPLYGLYVDDIDLKKLNQKEIEIREELSEKMSQYQKEKVIAINKRSGLFKKKKAKDNEDEEENDGLMNTLLKEPAYKPSLNRDWSKSETVSHPRYSACTSKTSLEIENNVSKWLSGVQTDGKAVSQSEKTSERYITRSKLQRQQEPETNGYSFSKTVVEPDTSSSCSYQRNRSTSRLSMSSTEEDKSFYAKNKKTCEFQNFSENSVETSRLENADSMNTRQARTNYYKDPTESDNSDTSDISAKRKLNFEKFEDDEIKDETSDQETKGYIGRRSQYRRRKEEENNDEDDDDDIIAAWRKRQEETKTRLRRYKEED
ncbi:serine/threonine/tyrosine-interacting-like protein 2 [Bombina bombina]|uniref:serine/threonine/tyrosine-interacting-like protein 2 n=1 Tax=Bombina bombina TaxID=8345 RepID=UPI00235AC173|nr:serine/threonine/tyrosine-interacting-like protein 2 [Bombina bombina]XP_053561839.1 serine/threonine/tyrosine-interacting-like protein 2 [Bombina bombina]